MGIKKHKSTRFSTAVKAYLNDKFLIGEETGNKASPTQVARENSLDIETEDFNHRKAPYKDALTNVLSSCTCNKK